MPELAGELDFNQKVKLRRRFEELKLAHVTGLVLTDAQARAALDLAARAGFATLVELAVTSADLTDSHRWMRALSRVAQTVSSLRNQTAALGYLIACPIASGELRAADLAPIRKRVRALFRTIRERDDRVLIGVKHCPAAPALAFDEEDFIYAEVRALDPVALRAFVVSLHHLAEARPVLVEFAHPSPGQDEAVAVALGVGAAGVVALPVPAPVSNPWLGILRRRPIELMPFVALNGVCPPTAQVTPMVSVIVCARNAARTIRACMESIARLEYPDFEVIVVDYGSSDATAEIAAEFPRVRMIRQPNRGRAAARNAGLRAARGEIVAFTDSDCTVDPHWLTYLLHTMAEGGFDGCGGPGYAAPIDGWRRAAVAASPGAPHAVLLADDSAERLVGCNMMFRRAALDRVGGFDPAFTVAGGDVDVCWRIADAGMRLGYCPAAFVWHSRRNTVSSYLSRERDYGRAEALLRRLYPGRVNALGHIEWRGAIAGRHGAAFGAERRALSGGARADAASRFKRMPGGLAFLPNTLQWTIAWMLAAAGSAALGISTIPALAMLALGPLRAIRYAVNAPLHDSHRGMRTRMLVAMLAYAGPMVRALADFRERFRFAPASVPQTDSHAGAHVEGRLRNRRAARSARSGNRRAALPVGADGTMAGPGPERVALSARNRVAAE